ncbi:uncharacterized protein RAG0_05049 [Rhynchosporium agropyri]|uniref:Uncharacterized protein n=1 Tax=Rhynchosporium agropyri TaxID=914238 RepID=A0A1E1KBG0_9HELO|nr:uncharacterized protein RAG0_05049 [Rhynchosporium agropyri]
MAKRMSCVFPRSPLPQIPSATHPLTPTFTMQDSQWQEYILLPATECPIIGSRAFLNTNLTLSCLFRYMKLSSLWVCGFSETSDKNIPFGMTGCYVPDYIQAAIASLLSY